MIGATLYIVRCTARNRLRMRLKRLRQPRYLLGAIVGAAYLYLTIFARRGQRSRSRPGRTDARAAAALATIVAGAPPVIATGMLGAAALAWVVPVDTGVISFSDAETDFLFPAPVSRRQLVVHRLLRGQVALFIGSAVAMLVYPSISPGTRLRSSLALWLALIAMRLYASGVAQARRGFRAAEARLRQAALVPAALVAAAAVVVGTALVRAFVATPATDLPAAMRVVHGVATSGVASRVLAPFAALVRPLFATTWSAYFAALGPALLVAALVAAWLVRTDELFYEAEGHTTKRPADPKAARTVVARRAPWRLAESGRVELAFAWRGAVEMVRGAGAMQSFRPVFALAMLALGVVLGSRQRGVAQIVMMFAAVVTFGAVVLGPQMLRIDLRQDLRHIDVLKTWPLRPPDVIRGEILWPSAVLTVLGWIAIALVLISSGAAFARYPLVLRVSIAAAAAIVAPAMIATQLAIHNAAALAFPAWVALGHERPRGFDALGQRLILLGATMLLLTIAMAPGVAAAAAVWFAFSRFAGPVILVPAAIVCAAIVLVELLVATEAIGPLYDRLDLSEIERAET